jgi:ATP-dependent Clp protease ATP-binding subunit ClpC
MSEEQRPSVIRRVFLKAVEMGIAGAAAIGGHLRAGRPTEGMRRINARAEEEAVRLGTNLVGPEHYLLALAGESDCVGARVLEHLGIPLDTVRQQVLRQIGTGPGTHGNEIQLAASGKRVLDLACEEQRQLFNSYLETDHLLLGLIREREGLASRVLGELGADLYRARRQVYMMQQSDR